MAEVNPKDLYAYVRFQQDRSGYAHVWMWVTSDPEGHGIGSVNHHPFDDLRASCQMDIKSGKPYDDGSGIHDYSYGWHTLYQRVWSVDIERAEEIAKVLRKVNNYTEKVKNEQGYPRTFGQYLGRVIKALGLGFVVIEDPRKGVPPSVYPVSRLGHAMDEIDCRIRNKTEQWGENLWIIEN